ncbi:MAG: hypothetical protein KDB88_01215, partial [Flavobacteriales bacterium]|nr:hypothetical protein [Flavobacteriales bacterium]
PVPVNMTISSDQVLVSAKLFLDGPYDNGSQTMTDQLRAGGLISPSEPYTALGYTFVGGGGGTIQPAVLSTTGNNAIVDWVVVELRDKNNSALVLEGREALVQRDGDVVALDGTSPVSFALPADNYFVAVSHRNHLGCMRSSAIALSASTTVVDFTLPATSTFGTNARRTVNTRSTLWTGNALFDGVVKYAGSGNDRDRILSSVGGAVPTATLPGYHAEDVNLDGVVKYAGSGNDRDRVLQTIGGAVPTATRVQQLP